jgi:hypothetical protein
MSIGDIIDDVGNTVGKAVNSVVSDAEGTVTNLADGNLQGAAEDALPLAEDAAEIAG